MKHTNCSKQPSCKHCYDQKRQAKMKAGTWKYNPIPPTCLTDIQAEVLIGSLLGDGSLYKYKNQLHAGLSIGRSKKDSEYLRYEYDLFKPFCKSGIKSRNYFDKRTNKTYYGVSFRTQIVPPITEYHSKWYQAGIKTIPKDLALTPLICAIWFCDDGCFTIYGKNKDKLKIVLSTEGFTQQENIFLMDLLNKTLNANFLISYKTHKVEKKKQINFSSSCTVEHKTYFLYASDVSARKFLNYILPAYPESMKRKLPIL